eukprot:1141288-Pelagomonas_calceolata.AAC.8
MSWSPAVAFLQSLWLPVASQAEAWVRQRLGVSNKGTNPMVPVISQAKAKGISPVHMYVFRGAWAGVHLSMRQQVDALSALFNHLCALTNKLLPPCSHTNMRSKHLDKQQRRNGQEGIPKCQAIRKDKGAHAQAQCSRDTWLQTELMMWSCGKVPENTPLQTELAAECWPLCKGAYPQTPHTQRRCALCGDTFVRGHQNRLLRLLHGHALEDAGLGGDELACQQPGVILVQPL